MRHIVILSLIGLSCDTVTQRSAEQNLPDHVSLRRLTAQNNKPLLLSSLDLGVWMPGQRQVAHKEIWRGDAAIWPYLRLLLCSEATESVRADDTSTGEDKGITIGEALFRYQGNTFYEWQAGDHTRLLSAEHNVAQSIFQMSGGNAEYTLSLRAVIIDAAFDGPSSS